MLKQDASSFLPTLDIEEKMSLISIVYNLFTEILKWFSMLLSLVCLLLNFYIYQSVLIVLRKCLIMIDEYKFIG
jgi:hypothetical protein